jgi:CRISPR-associated protein Csh2
MGDGTRIGSGGVKTIKNNSEILYIYDARMCNPNGDPDDENKPRMDYNRDRNLVSDVRLKRYIRDYLMDYKKDKESNPLTVFVRKIDGSTVNAKTSLATVLNIKN